MLDGGDVLAGLASGPLLLAIVSADGQVTWTSQALAALTGLEDEVPAPAWLLGKEAAPGDRQLDVTSVALGTGGRERLVIVTDRTDVATIEDQLWEQQTRLSKAYSELSVRNQALTSAMEKLSLREAELSLINRDLQAKVKQQLDELERSNKLRRYLSPEVASSIVSSDAHELSTKKRVLTIFFADIGSFDEMVAELESEEIIELLNSYRQEMTGIIFKHGGTLDKFISARIMGFFGDPVAHDDHALRAARMAVEMRDRVRVLRQGWFSAAEGAELSIGIHTGYATVGNVGSEQRVDYTAIGKNVAFAAALAQEAKPGQVLLSGRTHDTVKAFFEVESVQVTLKSGSRPVTAYNVCGLKSMAVAAMEKTEIFEPSPNRDAVGSRLGPYVLQEKIGEGGMGVVYRALDERLQRLAAVKVLPSELAADRKFVARFRTEAQALASLSSPYVAQIYFISDREVPPFFAMEYVDGPTLRRVLADQGKLPLRRALDLVTQIARGLEVAAEKGVIHRDIKPENVMLTLKGQVKLTDFGLVKSVGAPGMTSRGIVLGTPLYMSPEQARGHEVDLRSDVYSLGATFFHMIAGEPPFRADTAIAVMRKHEEAELPALQTLPPTVSGTVYQIVCRMLAKDPWDRFQDYASLIAALDAC